MSTAEVSVNYVAGACADEAAKIAAPPSLETLMRDHDRITGLGFRAAIRLAVIEAECQRIAPPRQRQQSNSNRMFQAQKLVIRAMQRTNPALAGAHSLHKVGVWRTCKRCHKRATNTSLKYWSSYVSSLPQVTETSSRSVRARTDRVPTANLLEDRASRHVLFLSLPSHHSTTA